jgi:hypothetical protein
VPLLPRPRDVISVHQASSEIEARAVCDVLISAGFPAMVRSRVVPGYEIATPPGAWGDVLVRPEDEAEAQRVIDEYLASLETGSEGPAGL